MGFREFADFNLAMLAKTAWRVLQNPDALWVKMLKGLYYPRTDFLNARKGGRASWAWSSILAGREVIKSDLIWRIGDGSRVRVWKDRWVGGEELEKTVDDTASNSEMLVNALVRNCRWDVEVLKRLFKEEVVMQILQILVSQSGKEDKLTWKGSRNGNYSVKEGYALIRRGKGCVRRVRTETSYSVPNAVWQEIWRLKVCTDPVCIIFGKHDETIEHCLLLRDWVKRV